MLPETEALNRGLANTVLATEYSLEDVLLLWRGHVVPLSADARLS